MNNKLLTIFIFVFYCSLGIGQTSEPLESGVLRKKTIRCMNDPEKFREIIYEYSNGKLVGITNYSNTLLTDYEVIQYNQFGNEEKRTYYGSKDEIIRTILTSYDSKQKLLGKKQMNNNGQIVNIKEYDILSRIVADNYFRDPYQPDVSCYYFLYEYSGENLVKKSFYMNCALRSYEINIYDNFNKKIKTEFYSYDRLTKYIVFKYDDSKLTQELTYDRSRDTKLISEKKYIYNADNQLTEIIENGNLMKKNYYADKKLVRSENYDYTMSRVPRPDSFCKNNIVEYEYY